MRKSGRRIIPILLGGLIVMGLVWQRIEATDLGYAVENSRENILRIMGENAKLEKAAETELSCAELAQAASARLGMVPAPVSAEKVLPDSPLKSAGESFLSDLLTKAWRRARLDARLFSS